MSSLKVLCLGSCFILLFTTMSIVQSRVVYRPKHSWIARDIIVATWEEAQQHCESQGDNINDMYYWWDEEFRGIRDCVILAFTSKLITRFCNISDYEFIYEKVSTEAPTMTVVPSSAESKQTDDAPMTTVARASTEPKQIDAPTMTVATASTVLKQTDVHTTTVAPASTEPKQTDAPTTTVAPASTEPKQTDTSTTTVAPSSNEPKQTDAPTTNVAPASTEPKQTDAPTTTVAPAYTEPTQRNVPVTVRDRTSVPLDGTVDCGSGYKLYATGSCYKVHKKLLTWDVANSTCAEEGGYLVVINDSAEAQILKEISGVTKNDSDPVMYFIWIGVRKETETDNYRSVKGDDINDIYHRWDGRFLYNTDCAILKFTGELSTSFCSLMEYAFICEKESTDTLTMTAVQSPAELKHTGAPTTTAVPSSNEPTQRNVPVTVRDRTSVPLDGTVDCGSGYKLYATGSCYKVHKKLLTWDVANSTCAEEGGYLVVINDNTEAQILKEISGVTKNDSDPVMHFIWIGVRKETETDNYRSVKGDDINDIYHRWDGRFLYNTDCAILKFTGELSTRFCSLSDYAFICEKESTDTLTMTAVQSPAEPKHTGAPTTTAVPSSNKPTQRNVPATVHDRTSVPLDGTVDCGSGYKLYAAGTCYKVHTKPEVSWDSANSTCSAEGGYIVVVNDKYEAKILKNIVGNFERSRYHVMAFFWVGIRWEPTANYYRSVKGDDINYIYFSHWYRDFHTDTKECALMDYDFYLRTKDCTDHFPYICEKEFN